MKFLRYFLIFFLGILEASSTQSASITKLYQHEGKLGDKVVCYLENGDPICNRLPQRQTEGKLSQETFFLPMANLVGDAKTMAAKLNGLDNGFYKIVVQEVTQPIKGVRITFQFDPARVSIDYAGFDAISRKKGIVFSIHDKTKLHEISVKTAPILKLAMGKKKPKIIVDPGHGGSDPGKVGCHGVEEKAVTLLVCKKLAERLQGLGYDVSLTRYTDQFVSLDERTRIANKSQGDLFISLHANSAQKKSVEGIETYCLNPNLFTYPHPNLSPSKVVAKRFEEVSKLSNELANKVHAKVLGHAQSIYALKDRSIRNSVAQVLLGTEMPSILIELGFLSNPHEAMQLTQPDYQKALVNGICSGINAYFKKAV